MLQAAANCAGTQLHILPGNYAGKETGYGFFLFSRAFTMPENAGIYDAEIKVLHGIGVWGGRCGFIWGFF